MCILQWNIVYDIYYFIYYIESQGEASPAGGNPGCWDLAAHLSLNTNHTPPVSGALGVIGLSGRAYY